MTTLFYLMSLLFIGYELLVLFKPYRFKDIGGPIKEFNQSKAYTYDFITSMIIISFQLFYICWSVIGLFSSNALYFLLLLVLGIVTGLLKHAFRKADVMIVGLDAFCSIWLLCVIFINHFS